MTSYWSDKVCLVTGASAGLGLAISQAMAARGARLVLVARGAEALQQTAQQLSHSGATAHAIACDVTRDDDVANLAREVQQRYGTLDCLCNCAGQSARQAVLETSTDDFQHLWSLNFLSIVRLTRAFAAPLTKQRGHVINIGSLAGKVAPRFLGAYPVSKFAVSAYSQQLRLERGEAGLHVLVVHPGPIQRNDASDRYARQAADLPPEARQPAAGARLRGIDSHRLAEKILVACERRRPELVVPAKARLLFAVGQLSPRLGDWLLTKMTSGKKSDR